MQESAEEREDVHTLETSLLELQMTSGCLQSLKDLTAVCKPTIRLRKGTAEDPCQADIGLPIPSNTEWITMFH